MQDQCLLVQGPCLLIHLSPTSNHLKGDMCQRVYLVTLEGALHGSVQMPPCHANLDVFPYLPSGGIEYNPEVFEQRRLSTYAGLDEYDTLFEARHGRGAVDNIPKTSERTLVVPPMGMPSTITSADMAENLMVGVRPKHTPDSAQPLPDQREHVSKGEVPSMTGPRVVSPINN